MVAPHVMLHAALGRAIITPETLPVDLAGFSPRPGPAEVVDDDLEVRVLVIADDTGRPTLALVVLDLLGLSSDFADPIRLAVGEVLALDGPAVVTAAIHTHAAPSAMAGTEALGWRTPDGYGALLAERSADAARDALASLVAVDTHHATVPLPAGVAHNRRDLPYDSPTVELLVFRSLDDGAAVASLVNAGVHPVALGREHLAVSSDWVAHFRPALEAAWGGRVVLVQGALGDVNPCVEGVPCEGVDGSARHVGEAMAAGLRSAWDSLVAVEGPTGVARHRRIEAPVGTTPLAMLTGATGTIAVELIEWTIAGVPLLTVPGEPFTAFGAAVGQAVGRPALQIGLSPVWQGYLPVPWGDGYEETVSYGPEAVTTILEALCDR